MNVADAIARSRAARVATDRALDQQRAASDDLVVAIVSSGNLDAAARLELQAVRDRETGERLAILDTILAEGAR